MAVYKATYCYPFLGSCDIRVAPGETQWITCKVDSSNKKVTGYRITIYDENNKLIFPHYDPSSKSNIYRKKDWNISPVSELSYGSVLPRDENGDLVIIGTDGTKIKLPSQEYLTNSGVNGSYLNLPFFQNQNGKITSSVNAVYYQPRYQAEYLIRDIKEGAEDYGTPENSANWILHDDGRYYYNKKENDLAVQESFGSFMGKLNGDSKLRPYQTVLFYKISNDGNVFFVGSLRYENDSWSIVPIAPESAGNLPSGSVCVITRGSYHDRVYVIGAVLEEYVGDLWRDAAGNKIPFSIGKAYKWVVTLYQGDGKKKEVSGMSLMDYSSIDVSEWYDMALQKGQILGSCPSRIQIAKYNESNNEYVLPKNKDGSSVILYKTYAQLVDKDGKDVGSRFYVNTYSSSLGHVYPLESDANTINIEGASSIEFFKHSNNPEAILDTDMVDMASVKDHVYNAGDALGNVELCGVQNIDDVVGENGKYVLVMYQKNPVENGVYKMTSDSDNTISVNVGVKTTDENGKVTESTELKTYKRDSSKDEYEGGLPSKFAWTHEKNEKESNQKFELTLYTKSRYCKKDDEIFTGGGYSESKNWSVTSHHNPDVAEVYEDWSGFLDSSKPHNGEECTLLVGNSLGSNLSGTYLRQQKYDLYTSDGKKKYACFVAAWATPTDILGPLYQGYPRLHVLVSFSGNNLDWEDMGRWVSDRYLTKPKSNSVDSAEPEIESTKMATWTRAGGYTSWSDYIGKIIYVRGGGKNGGKNFASTAATDGTLLKRPYADDQSTATPLYFVPERSVVLFPQLLNNDYSIKALGELKKGDGMSGDTVDGVILSSGDYYIQQSTGEIWQYPNEGKDPIKVLGYYYINQGQTNGLQVCKISKTGDRLLVDANSKDLNRAEVLKNTTTKTYIGQYINLGSDMVLRFDDKVVKANDEGSTPKDYLKVQKVDRVVWSIEHEKLESPFRSYSNNTDEPYHYKICTFYKKSDENPFYFRETPYLIINDGLADGYSKDDDYKKLSVYPFDPDSDRFGETEVNYDLNVGNLFNGKPSEALKKLSYSENVEGLAHRAIVFDFPYFSADTNSWVTGRKLFKVDLGAKASEDEVKGMKAEIKKTYEKPIRKHLGPGEAGLKSLQMPAAFVTAAKEKWVTPPTESKENFLVLSYAPISTSGYKLPLNGLYKQGNGASWESYRWVLEKVQFDNTYDSEEISRRIKNGDPELFSHIAETLVIKDTGNKYDKKMNVVFYGLLDNLEESDNSNKVVGVGGRILSSNIYLVTLYVTDENGITESERRFFEYKAPGKDFDYCIKSFKAAMDCQKECVEISVSPEFMYKSSESPAADEPPQPSMNTNFLCLKEFSIFKREYKKLYRYNNGHKEEKILIGNKWDPVVLNLKTTETGEGIVNPVNLLDFNIKSGYSYQYVIFPGDYSESIQRAPYIYANTGNAEKVGESVYDQNKGEWRPFSSRLSKPVRSTLQYWSIVNLIPVQEDSRADAGVGIYVADTDNVWLFKYQLENGSLTQNISKNEFSTLGQYPKIGIGKKNFLSGSVSCYLGSEIIPLSKAGYIERVPASKEVPLSTNEKAFMVEKWRELVATGTPKLLRDTKGQSWIVQIMDGTTTTNESVSVKPDTINFSWHQIADANDAIIYARQDHIDPGEVCSDEWQEDSNYE